MQYLFMIGLLLASQPLLVAHSEVPKAAPLEEVYQVASQETSLLPSNPSTTPKNYSSTRKTLPVVITGYSSAVEETDDTPFITASGAHVREGFAAANFLPLGTAFRIPKLYGDKVFIVKDRMNARYSERVDIWFADKASAKRFGIKTAVIEVL